MTHEMTRRDFALLAGFATAAGLAVPRRLFGFASPPMTSDDFFDWKAIGTNLHAGFGGGGNALAAKTSSGALLIDCKNPGLGATLRREAEQLVGGITNVINTHHHADHVGGNYAFSRDTVIVAHANAVPRLETFAGQTRERLGQNSGQWLENMKRTLGQQSGGTLDPVVGRELAEFVDMVLESKKNLFAPTETLTSEKAVDVGSLQSELRYIDRGHTDNDIFVYLPEQNVMHAGDLVFHELHPFIAVDAGATTVGWQRCLDAMMKVADGNTVVIPGHGEITDRTGLQKQKDYFDKMRAIVQREMKAGKSREEIVELKPAEFTDYGFERLQSRNLGTLFDELSE